MTDARGWGTMPGAKSVPILLQPRANGAAAWPQAQPSDQAGPVVPVAGTAAPPRRRARWSRARRRAGISPAGPETVAPGSLPDGGPGAGGLQEPPSPRAGSRWKTILAVAALILAVAALAVAGALFALPRPKLFHHEVPLEWLLPAGAVAALAVVVVTWRWVCRLVRDRRPAAVLTFAAAAVASVDAATGMWRFFGTVLHFDVLTRAPIFAFLEIAVITFALRARDHLLDSAKRAAAGSQETPSRGVNGVLMWVVTGLSAVLSAMAARSPAEAAFRLATPLVAALLWERGLSAEYQRTAGRTVSWRFSLDRVLVWLGLAEPVARDIGQVAVDRRLTQAAVAINRARRATLPGWRGVTLALARRRLRLAEQHAGLAGNEARQIRLIQQIAVLGSTQELLGLRVPSTWRPIVTKVGSRQAGNPHTDDQVHEPGPGNGDEDSKYAQLAGDLTEAIPAALSGSPAGAQRLHTVLASRDDYDELCGWLGRNGGAKRMMAATALYAGGDIESRVTAQRWIAALVDGPAGKVDKSDIRRIAQALEPVWDAERYPGGEPSASSSQISQAVPS